MNFAFCTINIYEFSTLNLASFFSVPIGGCSHGDVRLANNISQPLVQGTAGFPEVCYDGEFLPVCGHASAYFSLGTRNSFMSLCNNLGYRG